jgi:hypothetical protein
MHFSGKEKSAGQKIRQKKKLLQHFKELPVAIDEARIPGYNANHPNHKRCLLRLDKHPNSPFSCISRNRLIPSSSPPVFLRMRSLQIRCTRTSGVVIFHRQPILHATSPARSRSR